MGDLRFIYCWNNFTAFESSDEAVSGMFNTQKYSFDHLSIFLPIRWLVEATPCGVVDLRSGVVIFDVSLHKTRHLFIFGLLLKINKNITFCYTIFLKTTLAPNLFPHTSSLLTSALVSVRFLTVDLFFFLKELLN